MLKLLVANDAQVNAKAKDGKTPLHYSASWGRRDLSEILLASGANVNSQDNDSHTPLHAALHADPIRKDVVELLRQHGGHE